jgi:hypothetical protein
MKSIALALAVLLAGAAHAEPGAAKKELIAKVLKAQQPMVEVIARGLAEQPAIQLSQRAALVLQARVPADRREIVAREMQADLKKYLDEAVPLVRERAIKLAPTTIGTALDQNFSEEELRQLVAMMESPVNRKFLQLGGDMQRGLLEKLVGETRGQIEPKLKALEQSVAKRLGVPASSAPPAKPEKK